MLPLIIKVRESCPLQTLLATKAGWILSLIQMPVKWSCPLTNNACLCCMDYSRSKNALVNRFTEPPPTTPTKKRDQTSRETASSIEILAELESLTWILDSDMALLGRHFSGHTSKSPRHVNPWITMIQDSARIVCHSAKHYVPTLAAQVLKNFSGTGLILAAFDVLF